MYDQERIKKVVVVGAGGVGFYVALILNRENFGRKLIVYDDDNFVGGHGHERLPKVSNRETLKVDHLRNFSMISMGDGLMQVEKRRLTVDEVRGQTWEDSLVVDCTDMGIEVRRPLWECLNQAGAQMLRVSYDGAVGVGVYTGLPLGARPGGGYVQVPSLAQSFWAGGLGAQAVHDILNGLQVYDCQHEKPGRETQAAGDER